MKRSLHGVRDRPGVAATLRALGQVSQQAGDLKQDEQRFDEWRYGKMVRMTGSKS